MDWGGFAMNGNTYFNDWPPRGSQNCHSLIQPAKNVPIAKGQGGDYRVCGQKDPTGKCPQPVSFLGRVSTAN